jgi:hypothetical protein
VRSSRSPSSFHGSGVTPIRQERSWTGRIRRAPERDEPHRSRSPNRLPNAPLRSPSETRLGARVDFAHLADERLEQKRILEFSEGVDVELSECVDGLGMLSGWSEGGILASSFGADDAVLAREVMWTYKL